MRKILTTLAVVIVLVALMALPVMAKPNVAFNTGLAIDDNELKGSLDAGYKFVTGGTDDLLDATLVSPTATPDLTDGMYPFCLNTNPAEKAKLMAYFEAKGWPQAYLDQIEAEIDGTAPFFYLKAVGGTYTLVDGFVYALFTGTEVTLRVNDDYPAGLYTYRGTLTNEDGDFDVQVKLKVK
ncbi:MAG: hypothetical protein JW732_04210 [Dehalococcoidia bacterium]|nr:hypothetical protein [Dehalococcoidia bacterium]